MCTMAASVRRRMRSSAHASGAVSTAARSVLVSGMVVIHPAPMPTTASRASVTIRFNPDTHERLRRIAAAEHRTVAAYLETLVARDLAAREEADRVVRVHVAPELADAPLRPIRREPDESDAEFARRGAVLGALFGAR